MENKAAYSDARKLVSRNRANPTYERALLSTAKNVHHQRQSAGLLKVRILTFLVSQVSKTAMADQMVDKATERRGIARPRMRVMRKRRIERSSGRRRSLALKGSSPVTPTYEGVAMSRKLRLAASSAVFWEDARVAGSSSSTSYVTSSACTDFCERSSGDCWCSILGDVIVFRYKKRYVEGLWRATGPIC